jgi:hypothetical protein
VDDEKIKEQFWSMFLPVCQLSSSIDRCRNLFNLYFEQLKELDMEKLYDVFQSIAAEDNPDLTRNPPMIADIKKRYWYLIDSLNQTKKKLDVPADRNEEIRRHKAMAKTFDYAIELGIKCQNKNRLKTEKTGFYPLGHCIGLHFQSELKRMSKSVESRESENGEIKDEQSR